MIPVVSIIGRSNVGKSTLFNYLTHTRDALVTDYPGLTRDRKYGYAEIKSFKFICVDTASIDDIGKEKKDKIRTRIIDQSFLAIKESNSVLFIVDARTGVLPADYTIARYLHSCKKPTLLIMNKIDGINIDEVLTDFLSLGLGNIYPISALKNRGLINLKEKIVLLCTKKKDIIKEIYEDKNIDDQIFITAKTSVAKKEDVKNRPQSQEKPIKLAIVGRPNVGKSTLINCVLGKERMVVHDIPGTTRDSIYIPIKYNNHKYIMIDTAGIRKRRNIVDKVEKFSVIKTLEAIKDANVVILIIDSQEGILDQDLSLLYFILKNGHSLVIVINKWDVLDKKSKEKIRRNLDCRLSFINFVQINFISALRRDGIDDLFASIYKTYTSSILHINAAKLTQIMNIATKTHQPPLINGHRIKLKYAHIGGYNPLTIVIHGNQVRDLPNFYRRYLKNFFYKSLNMIGTPIYIQVKEGKNPFLMKRHDFNVKLK